MHLMLASFVNRLFVFPIIPATLNVPRDYHGWKTQTRTADRSFGANGSSLMRRECASARKSFKS